VDNIAGGSRRESVEKQGNVWKESRHDVAGRTDHGAEERGDVRAPRTVFPARKEETGGRGSTAMKKWRALGIGRTVLRAAPSGEKNLDALR